MDSNTLQGRGWIMSEDFIRSQFPGYVAYIAMQGSAIIDILLHMQMIAKKLGCTVGCEWTDNHIIYVDEDTDIDKVAAKYYKVKPIE